MARVVACDTGSCDALKFRVAHYCNPGAATALCAILAPFSHMHLTCGRGDCDFLAVTTHETDFPLSARSRALGALPAPMGYQYCGNRRE
jgi:hypothetical protein